MDNAELVKWLNKELQTELPQDIPPDKLLQTLSGFINQLIQTDFQKLVSILYKSDVSENKLKLLLEQNFNQDTAPLIAKLLIEREEQKINLRRQFSDKKNISEDEKW